MFRQLKVLKDLCLISEYEEQGRWIVTSLR